MIPITRIDEYLAVISQDEDATGLPDQAVTRIDTYLSKIAGEAVAELPEPVTRIDRYLASIAGMDVVMYDPITRIDYYLAAVAGVYSGELPEPVTRIDHYLYNWASGSSLPWATFTGNPLQFDAPKAHTLRSTVVAFSPKQDLHGYDNPWPAGGNTNKLNPDTFVENYYISATGVPTYEPASHYSDLIPCLPNTAYTFSGHTVTASGNKRLHAYDSNGDWIEQIAFASLVTANTDFFATGTTPATAAYLRVSCYKNDTNTQVEKGSSATPWTPYSNECPISGWTGVEVTRTGTNVWDEEKRNGYYGANGVYYSTPSATSNTANVNPIRVKPNTAYYFKVPDGNNNTVMWYDADMNLISGNTNQTMNQAITSPANASFMNFKAKADYNQSFEISINYPSADQDYHPYTGETIPISWQDEAGTVYGGTLDVTSGVLTVTYGYVDLGTLFWRKYSSRMYATLADVKRATNNLFCSQYWTSTTHAFINADKSITAQSTDDVIIVYDSDYTDADVFKTAMNGVQLVYELATPVTYQLTPTQIDSLKGINTIWSDANGDVTVEARAEAVNLNALQSLNMLLGGRYVNNHTEEDLTDEEALDVLLGNR